MKPHTLLTKRVIGGRDYAIFEDGQRIGRIRYASERSPGVWVWSITVPIPGAPYGTASSYEAARAAFKTAWFEFSAKHGPEKLAKAYATMSAAERPGR